MKQSLLTFVLLLTTTAYALQAQAIFETEIPFQEGECWWGGAVGYGTKMPYVAPMKEFDLALEGANNQVVPFLVSNKGRFIWCDTPFKFEVRERSLVVRSFYGIVEPAIAGRTLREAYLAAAAKHFPPSGQLPDSLFFVRPQYNTWIELMYNQNQGDIIEYAQGVVAAGLSPGILMIDDNWQKYYGSFEFKPDRFPDPKAMIDKLHQMGFKVMVWVCPFVSPDSPEYRELAQKGYLIRSRKDNRPATIHWWNGQSACYDLTNPEAKEYFTANLKRMQEEYGVDGFKFDAGDNSFYNPKAIQSFSKDAVSVDHTQAWAEIGLQFPYNEYRACWKMGGQPLVQRLGDKDYSWDAVAALIPEMLAAGLMGYAYSCPDMIGGGQYSSFLNVEPESIDQRLVVRSAQIHAMMPMMQFSVAPWRVLDKQHMDMVRKAVELHSRFAPYIMDCAREAARTGEPIVRHMEYAFPGEGFSDCKDQFMLGDRYMVAPVVTGEDHRDVRLPKGRWRDDTGQVYRGNTSISIKVPLDRIAYFEKI